MTPAERTLLSTVARVMERQMKEAINGLAMQGKRNPKLDEDHLSLARAIRQLEVEDESRKHEPLIPFRDKDLTDNVSPFPVLDACPAGGNDAA